MIFEGTKNQFFFGLELTRAGESIPSIEKLITLTEIYDVSLDELVGIAENNSYSKLMKLVKEFAVEDIPENEDDEISAIVTRYLIFAKSINLDATSTLNGLQDIFLKKGKEGQ